jgi:FixJ family two-component response regulator
MPEMTGLDLRRHLRRKGLQIPTIVITAHTESGAREGCESAGAIAFLAKPIQDTSLLAAINDVRGRDAQGCTSYVTKDRPDRSGRPFCRPGRALG